MNNDVRRTQYEYIIFHFHILWILVSALSSNCSSISFQSTSLYIDYRFILFFSSKPFQFNRIWKDCTSPFIPFDRLKRKRSSGTMKVQGPIIWLPFISRTQFSLIFDTELAKHSAIKTNEPKMWNVTDKWQLPECEWVSYVCAIYDSLYICHSMTHLHRTKWTKWNTAWYETMGFETLTPRFRRIETVNWWDARTGARLFLSFTFCRFVHFSRSINDEVDDDDDDQRLRKTSKWSARSRSKVARSLEDI